MLRCGENKFEGFISHRNKCFYYYLFLPDYPQFTNATLHGNWNLKDLFSKMTAVIEDWVQTFTSIESFEIGIENVIKASSPSSESSSMSYSKRKSLSLILREVFTLNPPPVLSQGFNEVQLVRVDEASREHTLVASIPMNYPSEPLQVKSHDLPLADTHITPNLTGVRTLTELHKSFGELIAIFQPFWNTMETLDASCWVLEPNRPRFSDVHRRIHIAEYCSALLTFNPYQPLQRPNIEFRGMQDNVEKLQNCLERSLKDNLWDPAVDVDLNLITVLELESFPMKPSGLDDKSCLLQPGDCGICFEERFNDQTANLRCDNPRCDSQYHLTCLLTYLSGNLTNVRMKNAVFGKCPSCREPIGCPIASY